MSSRWSKKFSPVIGGGPSVGVGVGTSVGVLVGVLLGWAVGVLVFVGTLVGSGVGLGFVEGIVLQPVNSRLIIVKIRMALVNCRPFFRRILCSYSGAGNGLFSPETSLLWYCTRLVNTFYQPGWKLKVKSLMFLWHRECHDSLLGVQAVFSFVIHHGLWAEDDLIGHFNIAVGG